MTPCWLTSPPHLLLLLLPLPLPPLRIPKLLLNNHQLALIKIQINHPPRLIYLPGSVEVGLGDGVFEEVTHVGIVEGVVGGEVGVYAEAGVEASFALGVVLVSVGNVCKVKKGTKERVGEGCWVRMRTGVKGDIRIIKGLQRVEN